MTTDQTSEWTIPSWQDSRRDSELGEGVPTECVRCGRSGTLRHQFEHMGVKACCICADERVDEPRSEGGGH